MKFKAIIFDADGMIIKTLSLFSIRYQKKFGVPHETMLPFFKGVFQDCLIGKADIKEAIRPNLQIWKWDKSADEFLIYWFESERFFVDKKMIKEIKRLRKKGVKCYLATNQEKYRADYMKKEMGFEKVFDKIYFSYEIGLKKPDLDFFQFVMNDLKTKENIKSEEVMFWDDWETCVASANKAGFAGHVYKNFDDLKKITGDWV